MSMEAAAAQSGVLSPFEQLRFAREVILTESRALARVADRLDGEFCRAVQLIHACRGTVLVSGMGKAGLVGQKIMATLASTGTPSHFLHPAEAVHGDLGRVCAADVVLLLSQSGETDEIVRLLPSLREFGVPLVAVTGRAASTLGRAATVTIELGPLEEACALGLAPSTSTTAMLAVGDALALVVSRMRHFGREDFARFHPAGSLGYQLSKVEHHARSLDQCRVAGEEKTVREVLVGTSVPGRRTGATMLVDAEGRLSGIFTDSDLARLFEHRRDGDLDRPIREVMTRDPLRVVAGSLMIDAVALMAGRKISELPVVDAAGKPIGLIDITDVVALLPKDAADAAPSPPVKKPAVWRVVSGVDVKRNSFRSGSKGTE
jgi:arabinose-5-phosphate isomerase